MGMAFFRSSGFVAMMKLSEVVSMSHALYGIINIPAVESIRKKEVMVSTAAISVQ